MTRRDDPRLDGREPEFALPSRKPGIGRLAIAQIASRYLDLDLDLTESDVPVTLRHGGKEWPLGRQARKWFRLYLAGGNGEGKAPELADPLQSVPEIAEVFASKITLEAKETFLKNWLLDAGAQSIRKLKAREKIYRKKETL